MLDDLPKSEVDDFETAMLLHLRDEFPEIEQEIADTGMLSDETAATLKKVVGDFHTQYVSRQA